MKKVRRNSATAGLTMGLCLLLGNAVYGNTNHSSKITIKSLMALSNPTTTGTLVKITCETSFKGDCPLKFSWENAFSNSVSKIDNDSMIATATNTFEEPGLYPVKVTVECEGADPTGRGSMDPNDKLIDVGVGSDRFIREDQWLGYTIRFENMSNATASAQLITITDPLDKNLDWNTFELGSMKFGHRAIEVPEGLTYFYRRVDLRPEGNDLLVDVEAAIDRATGVASWTFSAIDPETGEFTEDPFDGFLPPNDTNHIGEGFVKFRIRPSPGLSSGTVIPNVAAIVFDWNEPIDTPLAFVTIDAEPPESRVNPLPGQSGSQFMVSWSGADETNGSGIFGYDLYVSEDASPYELWLEQTLEMSAPFEGEIGAVYAFYSVAQDRVGHIETVPPTPDAFTQVVDTRVPGDEDGDGIPDPWELEHGLNPDDGSDGMVDNDQDGFGAAYEYAYGTDPNDPGSVPLPTLYVDAAAPPGGNGSPEAPFDTIQAALDVAVNYEMIWVAEGVYSGIGNRDLDPRGTPLMLIASTEGSGCVIDCMGAGRGFYFHSNEDARTVLTGFILQNGRANHGGGMYCHNASPTIRNCILEQNEAIYHGGGMACHYASPSIWNCVFVGNSAGEDGGGVYSSTFSEPQLINTLVYGNTARRGGGIYGSAGMRLLQGTVVANTALENGGGLYCAEGGQVENTILYFNTASIGNNYDHEGSNMTYNHCCATPLLDSEWGTGNISEDPLLVDYGAGDVHLQSDSPCIDSGTNTYGMGEFDLDGYPRILNAIVDMGAYEYGGEVAPWIGITTPAQTVSYDTETFALNGLVNAYVLDPLWVHNAANEALETFAVTTEWTSPALLLEVGRNQFSVYGTNYLGLLAQDHVFITRETRFPSEVAWWYQRDVLVSEGSDYSAVNAGQLKWIALQTYQEFEAHLPGGAGTGVVALVESLADTDNYDMVNQGQLKTVAQPFYDRLWELGMTNAYPVGVTNRYPWSGTTHAPDYHPANAGQLKYLFRFDFSNGD